MDQDFDRYLKPFRSRFIQFVSSRQRGRPSEIGLCVDLGQSDVDQLNALMAGGEWQDLAAVVVLKHLENALTRALQASGSNTLVVVSWLWSSDALSQSMSCSVGKPSAERIQDRKSTAYEELVGQLVVNDLHMCVTVTVGLAGVDSYCEAL